MKGILRYLNNCHTVVGRKKVMRKRGIERERAMQAKKEKSA